MKKLVEYTVQAANGSTVSVWLPVSIQVKNGPFLNKDCQPNPKNPHAAVCTNWTRKGGWSAVQTHTELPKQMGPGVLGKAITGIRYAWSSEPCCPLIDRDSLPCPPNSCPIRAYNSTLPAAPFMAKIVDGVCRCTAPQVCG